MTATPSPTPSKSARMLELIEQDEALRESIRKARTVKVQGFATDAEYQAFRSRTREALKDSHIEFMSLIAPEQTPEPAAPAESEDLFDLDVPAAEGK